MLEDFISHIDLLLVIVLVLVAYKLLGSPLRGIINAKS